MTLDLDESISRKLTATLNNSKYILFELPMHTNVLFVDSVIDKLKSIGLIPILAHPERYYYFHKNFKEYEKLLEKGVLFQGNFGSIVGRYGNDVKKVFLKLLKRDMLHFLATDCHRPNSIYINMPSILIELRKKISEDKLEILTKINPGKVIKNEDIIM